jgi:hypothetical protein
MKSNSKTIFKIYGAYQWKELDVWFQILLTSQMLHT